MTHVPHAASQVSRRQRLGVESLEVRQLLAVGTAPFSETVPAGAEVLAAGEGLVLPDLVAWESDSRGYLHDYVIEGDLLRFTTALANAGAGDLELHGGPVLPDGTQQLFQRVGTTSGGTQDIAIDGSFTYHPTHSHIHFDGYAAYHLRQVTENSGVGDVVASGGKVSFCLLDVTKYNPSAVPRRFGTCGNVVQGITAGWADVYSYNLPDQWINIRGIPDGEYWLEVVVDPDNQLLESDESNNTTRILVDLAGGSISQGDRFEPNDSFATATNLGTVLNRQEPGLSIHDANDVDLFHVSSVESGRIDVTVEFVHSLGNLDVRLYDGQFRLLATANSITDLEVLSADAESGDEFYIEIYSADGAANGYELLLEGPGSQRLVTVPSNDPQLPRDIEDPQTLGQPGPATVSTLQGPDVVIEDVNLILEDLQHTYVADLHIELTSPAGTTATILHSAWEEQAGLLSLVEETSGFSGTHIDDQSSLSLADTEDPFTGLFNVNHTSVGVSPLSVFNGENAIGTWTLSIVDWAGQDVGALNAWSLEFTASAVGDRYEPNDDVAQSVELDPTVVMVEESLSIHTAWDTDYFSLTAPHDGVLGFQVDFRPSTDPVNITLLDSDLNQLATGIIDGDHTIVSAPVAAGTLIYVEIHAHPDSRTRYDLQGEFRGDFNKDSRLNAVDIDLLFAEIQRHGDTATYDLNWDGHVDFGDAEIFVEEVLGLLWGDANLDGRVDAADWTSWNEHRFQPAASWSRGDFNGDGSVDGRDFNRWNAHRFLVVEPSESQVRQTPRYALGERYRVVEVVESSPRATKLFQQDASATGPRGTEIANDSRQRFIDFSQQQLERLAGCQRSVRLVVEKQVVILGLCQSNQEKPSLRGLGGIVAEELLPNPLGRLCRR